MAGQHHRNAVLDLSEDRRAAHRRCRIRRRRSAARARPALSRSRSVSDHRRIRPRLSHSRLVAVHSKGVLKMNRSPLYRTHVVFVAVAALALPAMAKDDALSLVPANAVTVGMVRLADMRTSPLSSLLFEHTDRMSTDGEAERFLTEAGLSPTKDVDVLVIATTPRTNLGTEADVLVVAEGRFNAARLTAALV